MKKILLLLIPIIGFAQSEKNLCETLIKIDDILLQRHYQPKELNDSLSAFVYKDFLKRLDSDNRIFLQSDIDELNEYKYIIDDAVLNKNCTFLEKFYETYSKSVERYDKIINKISSEPLNKSSDETLIFSKKAFPYLNTEYDLLKNYKKRILFNILSDISELSKNKDSLKLNFDNLFEEFKTKNFEKFSCKYNSLSYSKSEFNAIFYNAYCNYFDPHTEYFSENDKSSFLSGVSADNLTFGLYVSLNNKDELIVDEVIPGSSAFNSQKIIAGDQILKIIADGKEYSITCSSLKIIGEIMTSSSYKSIEATFRKKTGEIYSVHLEKKIMKDYENNIYSYIIEKDYKRIGYIKIPSFYAVFENGKTNISEDAEKEIKKLKKDNIDGLIIDLQNNGGGSMDEAIKLSGMFLKNGPIAVLRNNDNQLSLITDPSKKSVYNGKLAVIINGFSASASELFTNTMQDYNRAIIIGAQSFGKATMQRIFPLGYSNNPTEFIKITLQKFYRISGQSNQYYGIKPDIEIPVIFNNQMPREKDETTALKGDVVKTNINYKAFDRKKINDLSVMFNEENKTDTKVNAIIEINNEIDNLYNNDLPPILLNFDTVFDRVNEVNLLWKKISDFNENENDITVLKNSTDSKYNTTDEFLNTINTQKIKSIKTDLSVFKAVKVLIE